ncbi:MAG: hypothetical protein J0M20_17715 [Burkholderiales bacterium]|nr:hypothetical protein [Burkholderiales bacterium]
MGRIHWTMMLIAALAASAAGAASAPHYRLEDLGALERGGQSGASAINNRDEVVGYAVRHDRSSKPVRFVNGHAERVVARGNPAYHSGSASAISDAGHITGTLFLGRRAGESIFVTLDGATSLFPLPNGIGAEATGVNSHGQVVGWQAPPQQPHRAFLMHDGQWQDLPVPQPGLPSYAYAINDAGQVVGNHYRIIDGVNVQFGALWQDGQLKESFGLPGSPYTHALAVNRQGWVTGYSQVGRYLHQSHAYIHRDGVTTDLETHPAARSHAYGINAAGEVVGDRVAGRSAGGFLYSGGRMWWLADLLPAHQRAQWRLVLVHGINDAGHIVGVAQHPTRGLRAVMLRRLDEPPAQP